MTTNIDSAKIVTIITGFLGSGKTTFLNEWIHFFKEKHSIVIENEVGKVNVDAQLVKTEQERIFELTGGCICCGIQEAFSDLLCELWDKRIQYDDILIEASGVADPAQLVRPFLLAKSTAQYYQISQVICLADASLIEMELLTTDIAKQQVACSDVIVLSKTDLVSETQLKNLVQLLQEINPLATVFNGNCKDQYPMAAIAACLRKKDNVWEKDVPAPAHASKIKLRKYDHGNISTLHFSFQEPFDLDELKYHLMVFLNFQSSDVFRIKGILSAHQLPQKIIVQTVAGLIAFEDGRQWLPDEPCQSDIVIIGKDLKSKGFEKMLQNCLYQNR